MASRRGISTIVDVLLLTTANADETHDDVITVGVNGVVAQGDAWRRGRLSLDSGVGTDVDIALQGDDATHIEDHYLLVTAADGLAE